MKSGKFIVLEGPEGSGKTTQVAKLAQRLGEESCVVKVVREPGGTAIGEQIRKVLLDKENGRMTVGTELLLYMACRAQLVHEVIRPALKDGVIVLADRFLASSIVYQGIAGGMEARKIEELYRATCGEVTEDLVVVLDVPAEVGLARVRRSLDRMESKPIAFHHRVREGYLTLASSDPGRYAVVDATGAPGEVAEAVWQEVKQRVLS